MSGLVKLTREQSEQLQTLEAAWTTYGPALQVAAAFSGGMGWKTVKGAEYLVRYSQGEDGKKQFRSYGRRSPETEKRYDHFLKTEGNARTVIKQQRETVALHCRLAKAYGLARLPGRQAEILDWFWYTDVSRKLSLFGGSALLAYEAGSKTLAPSSLVKEDHLRFFARTTDGLNLDEIAEACDVDRTGCKIRQYEDRIAIRSIDGLVCEILLPSFFLRHLDGEAADVLSEAFELPPVRALTVARDSRPIELSALDPRSFAIAAYVLGEGEEIWAERAQYAATLIRERWPEEFDPRQESAFPDLCLDPEAERPSRFLRL
jgi:hypothetical protein